jgi:hypothetical protein
MDPYTIRIFVADGDPQGVRILDRMNWTGTGLVVPRESWPQARTRRDFDRAGVYVLIGYGEADTDLPRIYVGEGDGIRERIDEHAQKKEFWRTVVAFVSSAGGLNKAHVQWLEHELVKRARENKRCTLDNGNTPQPPALAEHEVADVRGFLQEMLRILPLVEVRVFEPVRSVVVVGPSSAQKSPAATADTKAETPDTIVVPAQEDGFQETFLGENCWYAIRISPAMLTRIKFIAAYQSKPVSAVTHVAPVARIEPYGEEGKYKVVFSEPAQPIKPIPFGNAPTGSMQGPRYTTRQKLQVAKSVSELLRPPPEGA